MIYKSELRNTNGFGKWKSKCREFCISLEK